MQKEVKNEEIEKEQNTIKEEKSIASQSNIKNSANLWEFLCDAWHGRKMVSTIFYRLWLPLFMFDRFCGIFTPIMFENDDDMLWKVDIALVIMLLPLYIIAIKSLWSCSFNVKDQKSKYGGRIFAIFSVVSNIVLFFFTL